MESKEALTLPLKSNVSPPSEVTELTCSIKTDESSPERRDKKYEREPWKPSRNFIQRASTICGKYRVRALTCQYRVRALNSPSPTGFVLSFPAQILPSPYPDPLEGCQIPKRRSNLCYIERQLINLNVGHFSRQLGSFRAFLFTTLMFSPDSPAESRIRSLCV